MYHNKNTAPVVLFVYNRLKEVRETVQALQKNNLAEESKLFIFSDGPVDEKDKEAVDDVREYISTISGFKEIEISISNNNKGLAESIISGTTEVLERFDRVIVVEDDLYTSPYFLQYMNDALESYEKQTDVASVSGYSVPLEIENQDIYFLPGTFWWGWATWRDRWQLFNRDGAYLLKELKQRRLMKDYNINGSCIISPELILKKYLKGKLNTWALRWHASMTLENKLTIYPVDSFVRNIGIGSGINCRVKSDCFDTSVADKPLKVDLIPVEVSQPIVRKIKKFYLKAHLNLLYSLIMKCIFLKK